MSIGSVRINDYNVKANAMKLKAKAINTIGILFSLGFSLPAVALPLHVIAFPANSTFLTARDQSAIAYLNINPLPLKFIQ